MSDTNSDKHSRLPQDELIQLTFVIGAACLAGEPSNRFPELIERFKSMIEGLDTRSLSDFKQKLSEISLGCGWNLTTLCAEILEYPTNVPKVRNVKGEVLLARPFSKRNFDSHELTILNKFRSEVHTEFLSKALFAEFVEFEKLLCIEENYLGASGFAGSVGSKNEFAIERNTDEEFWRMVW